jgi:hypothetical protein
MSIPFVGKCFATAAELLAYLEGLQFGAWRPRFVTMHHTGAPDLKTWRGWQTRAHPITDAQWMQNLAAYYAAPPLNWHAGPHFFFTPSHYCVLSPPTARGVHAVSFNALSWGVECVGDFDSEPFDSVVRARYVAGLAALHMALGLAPAPFQRGQRGLHFHRDDPKTTKTCPGRHVDKAALILEIEAQIADDSCGDHPAEQIRPANHEKRLGTVLVDGLNVRAAASAKAPIVKQLDKGDQLEITGQSLNGDTLWLAVGGGFVAGKFIQLH